MYPKPEKLIMLLFVLTAAATTLIAEDTNNPGSKGEASRMSLDDEKAYFDRATANMNKGEWDEAMNNLSVAIRLNPKNALAYESRGGAYFAKGDMDKAISDFSQAIQIDPTNASLYFNRGSTYRAKHSLDKALADLNECLRLNPTNDMAYKTRAAVHSAKGELEEEINDWNQGLSLNPQDARAIAMRGFAYFMTSQFDRAVADYREAIRLDANNDLAFNNFAWLRATCPNSAMRNGKEAVELGTKACELTKWARWDWIDTLAAAYAEAGDYDEAIKHQKQALNMTAISKNDLNDMQRRLSLYEQHQPYHLGQKQ